MERSEHYHSVGDARVITSTPPPIIRSGGTDICDPENAQCQCVGIKQWDEGTGIYMGTGKHFANQATGLL